MRFTGRSGRVVSKNSSNEKPFQDLKDYGCGSEIAAVEDSLLPFKLYNDDVKIAATSEGFLPQKP